MRVALLGSVALHLALAATLTRAPVDHARPTPRAPTEIAILRPTTPPPASPAPLPPRPAKKAAAPKPAPVPVPVPVPKSESSPAPKSEPAPAPAPAPEIAPPPPPSRLDLFARTALTRAVAAPTDDAAPPPSPSAAAATPPTASTGPAGVGGRTARGGLTVADFLAEDLARANAQKGVVPPRVREVERRIDALFDPPFAIVDPADRHELFRKQMIGRMRTPIRVRELPRGEDPTRETNQEKARRVAAEPFFLGRRVEIFARQRPDGAIVELAVRQSSGFRAYDAEALAAVERALAGRAPRPDDARDGEIRTLWQLEATGYVVYSPTPTLVFDEATGKREWIYPLQKKVDKKVRLLAVY